MNRLIELVIVCVVGFAGFVIGGWVAVLHEREISSAQFHFTNAMLATGHYRFYDQIADYIGHNCYEAALTHAIKLRDTQAYLVAKHYKDSSDGQEILEYVKSKGPELLEVIQSGDVPELDGHWALTCPADKEQGIE